MATTDLGSVVRAELVPGEQVLWQGAPRQGVIFRAGDALLIPFSLLWCGFAVFWTVMAGGAGAPIFFPIFGLAFVCVGLYFVFGRFLTDAWARSRTAYAVTDRRVLVIRAAPLASTRSIDLGSLGGVEVRDHRNGRSTLIFGQSSGFGLMGANPAAVWQQGTYDSRPRFEQIERGRDVQRLILERTHPPVRPS